jgi:Uma2 family endonuclease
MMTTLGNVPTVTIAEHVRGPQQGRWTYKEYAALPDDGKRYEILNGVLYMAPPSPGEFHQTVVGRMFRFLAAHIEDAGLGRVYLAPFDVELAQNVVVQPDIFVILNENLEKITSTHVVGAPDLVVEVASPGTATYDRSTKQAIYTRAGVPEYWIVDPLSRTVEVFALEIGTYCPLGIFEGKATLPSSVVTEFHVAVERFFK